MIQIKSGEGIGGMWVKWEVAFQEEAKAGERTLCMSVVECRTGGETMNQGESE